MWYKKSFLKFALRKHQLNTDLHIHSLEDSQTKGDLPQEYQYKHLLDILGSAILKGLDIIGIVSRHSFWPGELAKQIVRDNNYDIYVLSGKEVKIKDGFHVVVFNAKTLPNENESFEKICERAHKEGGIVMVIQPSRRQVQKLNKLLKKDKKKTTDFIEIFNDVTQGGYSKSFVDTGPDPGFQIVMNSAARNFQDLDKSVMMSRIPRDFFVKHGIIDKDTGVNFEPNYLRNENNGVI